MQLKIKDIELTLPDGASVEIQDGGKVVIHSLPPAPVFGPWWIQQPYQPYQHWPYQWGTGIAPADHPYTTTTTWTGDDPSIRQTTCNGFTVIKGEDGQLRDSSGNILQWSYTVGGAN